MNTRILLLALVVAACLLGCERGEDKEFAKNKGAPACADFLCYGLKNACPRPEQTVEVTNGGFMIGVIMTCRCPREPQPCSKTDGGGP